MFQVINLALSFLVFHSEAIELETAIITSKNTPTKLLSYIEHKMSYESIDLPSNKEKLIQFIEYSKPGILIDLTYNSLESHQLKILATEYEIVILKTTKSDLENSLEKWVFYTHPSYSEEAFSIENLINYFNWENFFLVSSEKENSYTLKKFLEESLEFTHDILSNGVPQENIENYIGRIVKPTGIWKIATFNTAEFFEKVVKALEKHHMFEESAGFLHVNRGGKLLKEGTITVYEEGLEETDSDIEYETKSIEKAVLLMENLASSLPSTGVTNSLIRDLLEEETLDHHPYPNYTIYNTNEEKEEVCIGSIKEGIVNITEPMYLPGGVSQYLNEKVKLKISISTGFFTDGQQDLFAYILQQGAIEFLPFLNSDDSVLENFELVYNEILCATENFNYDYNFSCLENEDLAYFYISSVRVEHLETVNEVLKDTNKQVPMIGLSSLVELRDKEKYPYIFFVYSDIDPLYSIMATLVQYFGWKNIFVIDSNLEESENLPYFEEYCQIFGIKIHNDEDKRIFPHEFRNSSILEEYTDWYKHYREINVKVLVLFGGAFDCVYILQGFLNNGFRQGDLMIVSANDLSYLVKIVQEPGVIQNEELELLVEGCLSFKFLEYNTEYSREVMDVLYEKLQTNDISTTGYTIDSLLLGVYAIDELMSFGRDYSDPDILNENMRVQRFWGSTGLVEIDSSYNTRRDIEYEFGYIRTENGNQEFFKIGSYKVLGNPPLNIFAEPVFLDGSNTPPEDFREELWNCNFYKKDLKKAEFSNVLTYSIALGLILSTVILIGILSRKEVDKDLEIKESGTEAIMNYEDLVIFLYIVYEGLFVIFLGPDFSSLNPTFDSIGPYFLFLPERFFSKHTEEFWVEYNLVLGITGLWLLLFGIKELINLNCFLSESSFDVIYSKIMPLIAYLLFVPIVSLLLVILKCEKAIGPEITDSFLYNDCHTFCWKETHLLYSVFSLFALVLFILSVFHFRLNFTSSIFTNIEQSKKFVVFNTFFLLNYIILNFILKESESELFNVVYMIYLMVFVVYLSLFSVYNYLRTEVVENVVSRIAILNIILTVVFTSFSSFGLEENVVYLYVSLQISGCAILIVLGIFSWIKSPPMYKYKKNHNSVYTLFRFMFGRIEIGKLTTHLNSLNFPESKYRIEEEKKISDENFIRSESKE